jgi:hypothetical protein
MSAEDNKSVSSGRRSFVRKAAAAALGGAVVAFGLESPARAQTVAKTGAKTGTHPKVGATPSLVHVSCCELAFSKFCSPSPNCSDHWSWTCCAYVGSSLTRVTCYECYSNSCSDAIYGAAC